MKYGFVYIWRDSKSNRYYVGSHWGSENDGYICSSRWMRQARKRRPNDFKRKILCRVYTDRNDLLELEHYYLSLIKDEELKVKYFNLTKHLNGHWFTDDDRRLSVSQKISNGTKKAMSRPEVRMNYIEGLKNRDTRSSDPEVRKKRSESIKNKIKLNGINKNSLSALRPDATLGRIRVYKNGKIKLVIENSAQHEELKDDGWKTKLEILIPLVEKARYELYDQELDDNELYRRMVNIGYITEKERSLLAKQRDKT